MNNHKPILILCLIILSNMLYAQPVSQWRGPNRDGIYHESGLMKKWPSGSPEVLWQFDNLGAGHSSVAVSEDRIYTTGLEGEQGYMYAFDNSGKLLWKVEYGAEWFESYPGSRSTPTIYDGKLYIYSGKGDAICMDADDGRIIWKVNVFEKYGGENIVWGVTDSPLIYDRKMYIMPGGEVNNVIALNVEDGSLAWSSAGRSEKSAYCMPQLVQLPSMSLIVSHSAKHILGHEAKTGEFLWAYKHENRWDVHPNTPLYHDGQLFCFSGYGKGCVMLQITQLGKGIEEKWETSKMDSRMGGVVLVDGFLYGSGDKSRAWHCIDWATGEVKYESTEISKGNVIFADGMLYCYSERGEVALVEPTPDEFRVVSQFKLTAGSAQHWAHPVINDGRLFIRHGNALIVYNIKE